MPKVAANETDAKAIASELRGVTRTTSQQCRVWMNRDARAPSRPISPDAMFSPPTSARPAGAATITVHIPMPLRGCCAGAAELAIAAVSLRGALEELERHHPALHRSICDETGAMRRHINLFVNSDHMRDRNGLDTPLAPGDVVTILPAVSGG
jgi:molybdopterin converting factor small subunit